MHELRPDQHQLYTGIDNIPSGRSRFLSVWNQCAEGREIDVIERDLINVHLGAHLSGDCTARGKLDALYDPHSNYYGRAGVVDGAHGTAMASIAAGSPYDGFVGAAPRAELIGVHLNQPDTAWKEEDASGRPTWLDWDPVAEPFWRGWQSYADARSIVDALEFIYTEALGQDPVGIVINLSVGTWSGAHDGRSDVARRIDEIIRRSDAGEGPPVAIIVGAGNAGADEGHLALELAPGDTSEIVWRFRANAASADKLEVWFDAPGNTSAEEFDRPGLTFRLRARLHSPAPGSREYCDFEIQPGATHPLEINGVRVGVADCSFRANRFGADRAGRDNLGCVRISLFPPLFCEQLASDADGFIDWTLSAIHEPGHGGRDGHIGSFQNHTETVQLHAWRKRNDDPLRSTLIGSTRAATLCDFACAEGAIVVGGYDATSQGRSGQGAAGGQFIRDFPYASHGPVAWPQRPEGAAAPHLSAPAQMVWAAKSKSDGFMPTCGTSGATALVSGAAAVLFQRAAESGLSVNEQGAKPRGLRLDREALIDELLGKKAATKPIASMTGDDAKTWDPSHGFGCVSILDDVEVEF